MKTQELPEDYALVLLQIGEDGEDDFSDLAELMQVDKRRLAHVIEALQHKGLIIIRKSAKHPAWISLSSKGKRLMHTIWPESQMMYAA